MVRNKNTPRMSTSHSVTLAAANKDANQSDKTESSRLLDVGRITSSTLKNWKNNVISSPQVNICYLPMDGDKKVQLSDDLRGRLNGSSGALVCPVVENGCPKGNTQNDTNTSPLKSRNARPHEVANTQAAAIAGSRMHAASINMYRKMFGRYKVGQELLARWSDGLYYLGVICDVYDHKLQCQMKFEDDSRFWVHFKDLHHIEESASDDEKHVPKGEEVESDVTCVLCRGGKSEPPNEIVLCDKCGQGYHQLCHLPHIDDNVLKDEEVPWQCRNCVFSACVKRGGAVKHGLGEIMKQMKRVFPYDLHSLTWNKAHKINDEEKYCYCGGPGDWYLKMLQCARCTQWFHEACLQCLDSPILYGDHFFLFVCSVCNEGNEFIKRLPMKWVDVVHLVLYNITIAKKIKYYDVESMIVFFNKHVDSLRLTSEMAKEVGTRANLRKKIVDVMTHNRSRFQSSGEGKKSKVSWGLRNRSPPVSTTVPLPAHGEITEDTLASLDLRNGSAATGDSPTPLKKLGPCQFDGSSPRSLEKGEVNGTPMPGHKLAGDMVKSRLFDFAESEPDKLSATYDNMPPPERRKRGRPKAARDDSRKSTSSETGARKRKLPETSSPGEVSENGFAAPKLWRSNSSVLSDKASTSSWSSDKAVADVQSCKEAVSKYFGVEQRVNAGECFRILGKRTVSGPDGVSRVQYLIEWEGYTASDLDLMKKF